MNSDQHGSDSIIRGYPRPSVAKTVAGERKIAMGGEVGIGLEFPAMNVPQ